MGFAFSLPLFSWFVWEVDLLSSQVSLSSLEHKNSWSLGRNPFFSLTHVVGFGNGEFDEEDN